MGNAKRRYDPSDIKKTVKLASRARRDIGRNQGETDKREIVIKAIFLFEENLKTKRKTVIRESEEKRALGNLTANGVSPNNLIEGTISQV